MYPCWSRHRLKKGLGRDVITRIHQLSLLVPTRMVHRQAAWVSDTSYLELNSAARPGTFRNMNNPHHMLCPIHIICCVRNQAQANFQTQLSITPDLGATPLHSQTVLCPQKTSPWTSEIITRGVLSWYIPNAAAHHGPREQAQLGSDVVSQNQNLITSIQAVVNYQTKWQSISTFKVISAPRKHHFTP